MALQAGQGLAIPRGPKWSSRRGLYPTPLSLSTPPPCRHHRGSIPHSLQAFSLISNSPLFLITVLSFPTFTFTQLHIRNHGCRCSGPDPSPAQVPSSWSPRSQWPAARIVARFASAELDGEQEYPEQCRG